MKMNLVNTIDHNKFTSFTQFNVEKFKTYFRAMQSFYTIKWVKIIEEKLDQPHKNKT